MIIYVIVMLAVSAVFAAMAVLIYKGKTDLIHDYHRQHVKDELAYGKAFGKAMAVISGSMAVSAITALFGVRLIWAALAVLFGGIVAGIIALLYVQKKYNGGVFS